jgi:hypothetical protein
MTTIQATVGGHDVVSVLKRVDVWHEGGGVGRWELAVNNLTDASQILAANDEATNIGVNGVTLMKGYLDDVIPRVNDESAVYSKQLTVKGRNYGRDLANLFIIKKYLQTKIDDLMEDALTLAGSEITFSSSSVGSVVDADFNKTYLQNGFVDAARLIDYDFTVDNAKALSVWALASAPNSGVLLQSIAGANDNNILLINPETRAGVDIRNYVRLDAGTVKDHWIEGNASDWIASGTTTDITDETTATLFLSNFGAASIKVAGGALNTAYLQFPLYNHATLNWDTVGSAACSIYVYHVATSARFMIYLTDDGGNVARWIHDGAAPSKWSKIPFTMGREAPTTTDANSRNAWHLTSGGGPFSWKVTKFTVTAQLVGGNTFWMDALELSGVDVWAYAEDAASQAAYGKRMLSLTRTDIKSQLHLQSVADNELANRKDPAYKLNLTCTLQTALLYAGYLVHVWAPDSAIGAYALLTANANSGQKNVAVPSITAFAVGASVILKDDNHTETCVIASKTGTVLTMVNNLTYSYTTAAHAEARAYVTYRILSIHHAAEPGVLLCKNHDAITELELIRHDGGVGVDPTRFKLTSAPQAAINTRFESRLRVIESSSTGASAAFGVSSGGGGYTGGDFYMSGDSYSSGKIELRDAWDTWSTGNHALRLYRESYVNDSQFIDFAHGLAYDLWFGRKPNDDNLYISAFGGGTPWDIFRLTPLGDATVHGLEVAADAPSITAQALMDCMWKWVATDLTGTASSGQKVIPVTDTTGLANGWIIILSDNNNSETLTVDSVTANSITATTNLAHTYTVANAGKVDYWHPDDLSSSGTLRFKDNITGAYNDVELVTISDGGNDPITVFTQGSVMRKDLSVGGFLGTMQGVVYIGHGLTSPTDPPKLILSDSETGYSMLYLTRLNGVDPADFACAKHYATMDIDAFTVGAGGATVNHFAAFSGDNTLIQATITLRSKIAGVFAESKSAGQNVMTAIGRRVQVVAGETVAAGDWVTSDDNGHAVKVSGTHRHKVGDVGASLAFNLSVAATGDHAHYVGGTTGGIYSGTNTGNAGGHDHYVGGTTGGIYSGTPGSDHTHSSGGPGVEETEAVADHAHTIGQHTHSSGGSGVEETNYVGSHVHSLDNLPGYIRALNLRSIAGASLLSGGVLITTNESAVDVYTEEATDTTAARFQVAIGASMGNLATVIIR